MRHGLHTSESFFEVIEALVGLMQGASDLRLVEFDCSAAARTGENLVVLYPSDDFLRLHAALVALNIDAI